MEYATDSSLKKTWKSRVRPLSVVGDVAIVPLTKGKVAFIDAVDVPLIAPWNWHAWQTPAGIWYAYGRIGGRKTRLHNFLLGPLVDHRDGDGLNNRRSNLRRATPQENARNRRAVGLCRYKGVSLNEGRWRATIYVDRHVRRYLGTFASQEDAARAYNVAAAKYFGDFAVLNVIP